MATGRTKIKHWRVYVDGYDWSGFSRALGPLEIAYDEADLTAYMSDSTKGYLPNQPQVNCGTLNAVLDTNTINPSSYTTGVEREVLAAIGIRAAPVDGDPCFGGQFNTNSINVAEDSGAVTWSVGFSGWAADATTRDYPLCWGTLLHANAARTSVTGVNISDGFDNITGAATAKGGFFLYQVLDSNAAGVTATLSVDDGTSAADADMDPLAGATTGAIVCVAGVHGIVVPTTLTIRRYLRWQIAFGTATSVTWVAAFMRKI